MKAIRCFYTFLTICPWITTAHASSISVDDYLAHNTIDALRSAGAQMDCPNPALNDFFLNAKLLTCVQSYKRGDSDQFKCDFNQSQHFEVTGVVAFNIIDALSKDGLTPENDPEGLIYKIATLNCEAWYAAMSGNFRCSL